ncbi:hypothetical protein [Telluribacter sp. SYSU D00476]|uniref:hypothetical protein n=1 Tax=Telluribacter sp. SYSU D00476 TaxID=2811430 RepID=UPI001FF6E601|nr:hypothetical protein [Telluribacter sp. SYSU D00476]
MQMKKYQSFLGEKKMIKDQGLLRHEEIRRQIKVLPELEELIPPLQEDEFRQLEENIIKEGCREALLIWETTENHVSESGDPGTHNFILIDGHNRYRICQKNQLDFKIHLVAFPSLPEVREYMIDNQLGRRNLSPEQISYLRGKKYNAQKISRGKYDRSSHKGQNVLYEGEQESQEHKGQNVPYGSEAMGSTSQRLAKQFNVSEKTIKRDAEFAEGLDKLSPSLRKDILSGKANVKKSDIQQLAKAPITAGEAIEDLAQYVQVPATGKPANAPEAKDTGSDKKSELRKRLSELVIQLDKGGSQIGKICDEIVECASNLKELSKKK